MTSVSKGDWIHIRAVVVDVSSSGHARVRTLLGTLSVAPEEISGIEKRARAVGDTVKFLDQDMEIRGISGSSLWLRTSDGLYLTAREWQVS